MEDIKVGALPITSFLQAEDGIRVFWMWREYRSVHFRSEDPNKTVIEEGDIVNIDYLGKQDGVAFDGGTDQGFNLEIGSGRFIEGFEEGLVGVSVGEVVDLDLTFPETYSKEELAGKDVVFTVSVNAITVQNEPEYNDDLIVKLGMGDITTMAEYEEGMREYLQSSCDNQNQTILSGAIWDAVYAACEIKDPPQEMVDEVVARIRTNAETYATNYGVDFETFITNYFGMTEEEFQANSIETATEEAKKELVYMAIAKKEGIEVTSDKIQEYALAEYEQYGFETTDAYIEAMGEDLYTNYVLNMLVDEYLESVVTVTENEPVSLFSEQ